MDPLVPRNNMEKTGSMQILRKLILLALGLVGVGLAVEIVLDSGLRLEFTLGVGFLLLALVLAAIIFAGIQTEKLPLRSWYVLPLIVGAGFGAFGFYNLRGFLSDVSGMTLGVATMIFSFAAFRFWADTKGAQEWFGIIVFCALLASNMVVGAIAFFAQ